MFENKFKYYILKPEKTFIRIFTIKEIENGNTLSWIIEHDPLEKEVKKMRFTGIIGNEDKEIYEGDIVRVCHYDGDMKIKEGQVCWLPFESSFAIHFKDNQIQKFNYFINDIEVIGNFSRYM